MEINFIWLVIASLAGLIVNAIWKFNPWAMLGTFSLLLLFLPILGIGFQHDPQAVQEMTNNFIDRIINALPSLIIGELAGSVAAAIFHGIKGIFGHT